MCRVKQSLALPPETRPVGVGGRNTGSNRDICSVGTEVAPRFARTCQGSAFRVVLRGGLRLHAAAGSKLDHKIDVNLHTPAENALSDRDSLRLSVGGTVTS